MNRMLGVIGECSGGMCGAGAVVEGLYGCAGELGLVLWLGRKFLELWGLVGECVLMWELNTETEGPEEEYDQLSSHEIIPEDSRTD